jgi:hypothetical protein
MALADKDSPSVSEPKLLMNRMPVDKEDASLVIIWDVKALSLHLGKQ